MPFPPFADFWAAATQEQRDAAYNNNLASPDADARIAARNAAAAALRPQARFLDRPYGPDQRQQWDIFPAADPAAPCLVFIHGGYWQRNRREDFAGLAKGALARGWSFALCGYRLAPQVTLAEIVADLRAALDWLQAEGAAHGITGPVIASGWSAGGHLAALALEHAVVQAALAISGIHELAPLRDIYLNTALRLTDQEITELSPQRRPIVQKPMAIAYGGLELPELVRNSREFHALRSAAQAPGPLLAVPHANHFGVLDALSEPDGALLKLAATLLP